MAITNPEGKEVQFMIVPLSEHYPCTRADLLRETAYKIAQDVMPKLISFLGLCVMLLLAWILSEDRKRVHVRLIITGMPLQLVFTLLILKATPGRMVFDTLEQFVNGVIACGKEESAFLFGEGFQEHYFAFSVLPLIKWGPYLSLIQAPI